MFHQQLPLSDEKQFKSLDLSILGDVCNFFIINTVRSLSQMTLNDAGQVKCEREIWLGLI